jgi:UDP-glucose-4-epimerase GalE
MMGRILITGGAGYIGSHTAKALAARGIEPVVFDNLSTGNRWAVKWGPLIQGDLNDPVALRSALATVDGVIHFAASAYVGESMANPRQYFHNNVVNSLSLLDAMVDRNVRNIVFSSSCATYGVPDTLPISELHEQRPINPYGESKLFVEKVLYWYGRTYGIQWTALRYFNAAGADPDGEIGENHEPETHLIPAVIETALGKRKAIQVYGSDYETPDGTAVRDYIHVADLADAHILALQLMERTAESHAFNLGTGKGASVLEVIDCVHRVSGIKARPNIDMLPRRDGDPPVLLADGSKARGIMGWHPRLSSLERIVETAWRWHSQGVHRERAVLVQKRAAGRMLVPAKP